MAQIASDSTKDGLATAQYIEKNIAVIDVSAKFYRNDTFDGPEPKPGLFVLEGRWTSRTKVYNARFQFAPWREDSLYFEAVGLVRGGIGMEHFGKIGPFKLFGEYFPEGADQVNIRFPDGRVETFPIERIYAPPPKEDEDW